MDVTFVAELESIFRESFLKSAPLYQAAGKIKLPYEDIKGHAILYRGSLREESRLVEKIADYRILSDMAFAGLIQDNFAALATEAAHVVDGLIRLENVQASIDRDPRNTTNLKVTDIFECADGRRNLDIGVVKNTPNIVEPDNPVPGWIFYKFYFAAASIKQEYKN